jgi:hypothetical protein
MTVNQLLRAFLFWRYMCTAQTPAPNEGIRARASNYNSGQDRSLLAFISSGIAKNWDKYHPQNISPTQNQIAFDPNKANKVMRTGLATTMTRKTGNPLPGAPGFLTSAKLSAVKNTLGG